MIISASRAGSSAHAEPWRFNDDWSPDLRLLLGDEAEGPLRALIETADGELLSFHPRQVNHQPDRLTGGSSTVVQYAAQVRWGGDRQPRRPS